MPCKAGRRTASACCSDRVDRPRPPSYQQLFTIGLDGGAEQRLPLPIGYEGAFSPDGARIAYVPVQRAFTMWKRYRGGQTTPIWLADLATSRIERVPRDNSNDFRPMWAAGKVWFLSDREGPVTLFSYDPGTKRVARAVENRGMDFKSASAAGDAIVIEQFGGLHLYDLKSGRLEALSISVSGDLEEVRERFVKVGTRLTNASISPSGVRAVFEGRGEIITVPEEKGDARNLTNTPGVMERSPAWSPDGASVAYFSDESGEYALHIAPQDGRSAPRKIALGESTIYRSPRWSPDSKKIAFMDVHLSLWYVDLDSGKPVRVAKDRYYGLPDLARVVVAGFEMAGLRVAPRQLHERGARVFARRRQGHPGDRRDERCRRSGLGPERQVPVLHRVDGFGIVAAAGHPGDGAHADGEHLPDRARQGRSLAAVAAERRGGGSRCEQERRREACGWRRPGEAGRSAPTPGTAARR